MDYAYAPFRRNQFRNPSPFFSPATSVRQNPSPFFPPATSDRQRPHPVEPALPRRRGVVSIPVFDVNEDCGPQSVKIPRATAPAVALSKHAAAIRIQSVFRGRLVRKALAAVRALDMEVRNIEARVRESIGRIATDERERLVVGEMIMRVLLKLDGVRGVRDYRKKVVRRAVKLQEMIDSLAAGGDRLEASSGEEEEEEERPGGSEVVGGEETVPVGKACNSLEDAVTVLDKEAGYTPVGGGEGSGTEAVVVEEAGVVEESKNTENGPAPTGNAFREFNAGGSIGGVALDHAMEEESTSMLNVTEENPGARVTAVDHVMKMEEASVAKQDAAWEGAAAAEDLTMEVGSVSKPDATEATSTATVVAGNRVDAVMGDATSPDLRGDDTKAAVESSVENAPEQDDGVLSDYVVVENAVSPMTEDSRQDCPATTPSSEGNPEPVPLEMAPPALPCPMLSEAPVPVSSPVETAVGRMTQENERLVGLVEELLQRSELQCRLVCQLTRRVESLEKKVEKMGKKKRKHAGDASAIAAADKKN